MSYQVRIPSSVYGGEGCLSRVKDVLEKEHVKKAMVFTDAGIERAGLTGLLTKELEEVGVACEVFDNLVPEPSYHDVERVMETAGKCDGDFVIAIGGGSVMDVAKLCTVLKGADYTVKDLLGDPKLAVKRMRSLMIPTTCGTGAEATCNSIVAVPEEDLKVGIVNEEMIPDYVILDPAMIAALPKQIVAATGVDALAHAVECYTSKKASPLSDTYALASAKLIFANIKKAYAHSENIGAKNNMLLGAFYGGVAITGSGTTAVHALSYPLGGKYHIAHGVSNAVLFAHVMEFNRDACADRLATLCDAIRPDLSGLMIEDKAQYIIDEISDIVKFTNIPTKLEEFGVKPGDLESLAEAGSKVTRLLSNNRRKMTLEDIRSIYRKVL
jgi:alcohol dehydrogenase class IV